MNTKTFNRLFILLIVLFISYGNTSAQEKGIDTIPGFSLNGSSTDITLSFIYILLGTWAYSWFLSLIWFDSIKTFFTKNKAKAV